MALSQFQGHTLMARKKTRHSLGARPVTPELLCRSDDNNNSDIAVNGNYKMIHTPLNLPPQRPGPSTSLKRTLSVPRQSLNGKPISEKRQISQRRRTLSGPRVSQKLLESIAFSSTDRKTGSKKDSTIVVACRVRPFLMPRENGKDPVLGPSDRPDQEIQIVADKGERRNLMFKFDKVFDHSNSKVEDPQEEVFQEIGRPLLESFLEGFNCTLFHYGQTGSGKTYSMMGTENSPGILPKFCDWVFRKKGPELCSDDSTVFLEISYFEIYNEEVFDLLSSDKRKSLRVRNHDMTGPYVEGLLKKRVSSMDAIHEWLEVGWLNRATAPTGMNERSSRSHAVFQITLHQTLTENVEGIDKFFGCKSTVNLVDLAGSERSCTAQEGAVGIGQQGKRYKETVAINSSLTVLRRVITALSDKTTSRTSSNHVPYRESNLTWLLKDALGGNAKTTLLATISPCLSQKEETISTLRFGSEASKIITAPKVNEDKSLGIIRRMKELQNENLLLRRALGGDPNACRAFESLEGGTAILSTVAEQARLQEQLKESQARIDELKSDFDLQLAEELKSRSEEIEGLKSNFDLHLAEELKKHEVEVERLKDEFDLHLAEESRRQKLDFERRLAEKETVIVELSTELKAQRERIRKFEEETDRRLQLMKEETGKARRRKLLEVIPALIFPFLCLIIIALKTAYM